MLHYYKIIYYHNSPVEPKEKIIKGQLSHEENSDIVKILDENSQILEMHSLKNVSIVLIDEYIKNRNERNKIYQQQLFVEDINKLKNTGEYDEIIELCKNYYIDNKKHNNNGKLYAIKEINKKFNTGFFVAKKIVEDQYMILRNMENKNNN